ncbi:hypothetical protein SAMN04487969_14521 [Paenibacillus algorifonticola]|uniref:Uncharacterized protein n=1 Tax=Paenibacillus algorifonticola TaxID=684063 RepID=A0A1I2IYF9_9BACL|nr:hypothetical protein [Paenibacillus algorifonticola]SFF46770.1 hypothetical protein SAMN04487969_14521 [Paenibacillus algorifonticola]
MAKMQCKCGEILSNSKDPNDVQLWVFTDKEFQDFSERAFNEEYIVYFPKYDVWKCNSCERIYFFENGKLVKSYILE